MNSLREGIVPPEQARGMFEGIDPDPQRDKEDHAL
jgi:hypothetical protein